MPVDRALSSLTNNSATTAKAIDPHGYAAKEIRRRSLNSPKPAAKPKQQQPTTNTPDTQQSKVVPASSRSRRPSSSSSSFQGWEKGKNDKVEYAAAADSGAALPPPSPQQLLSLPPPPPRYEPLKRLSYALPPNLAKARPPAPPSPEDAAGADEDVVSEAATAASDGGALAAAVDSDTVTLDRSDFRQLVIALRNLREQRTSDLEQLGRFREALVGACQVAAQEAPSSQPVVSMIERLKVGGLLPHSARFEVE